MLARPFKPSVSKEIDLNQFIIYMVPEVSEEGALSDYEEYFRVFGAVKCSKTSMLIRELERHLEKYHNGEGFVFNKDQFDNVMVLANTLVTLRPEDFARPQLQVVPMKLFIFSRNRVQRSPNAKILIQLVSADSKDEALGKCILGEDVNTVLEIRCNAPELLMVLVQRYIYYDNSVEVDENADHYVTKSELDHVVTMARECVANDSRRRYSAIA